MKIMSVVGARPNFMKVAPIISAINDYNNRLAPGSPREPSVSLSQPIQHVLVHTGQHYDAAMSGSFFKDLGLPAPDVHLGVGSSSHAVQTAEIMKQFEEVLLREKPDVLIVVGDVNSTVACSLVAAKIAFDTDGTRPVIAHVEAGLRSFDRSMPEEINRIVTDHLSDLLFVTEESGLRNLSEEGIGAEKVHFVGNTMIDSLLSFQEKAEASTVLDNLGLRLPQSANGSGQRIVPYALLTLHRPANVDNREAFLNILEGLEELAREYPVIFPAHPRTQKRVTEFGFDRYFTDQRANSGNSPVAGASDSMIGLRMIEPLGYLDFLCTMKHATLVVTDSGGIQEETTCLGIPCVTVRENTERPVTVETGTNIIAGTGKEGIKNAIRRQMGRKGSGGVPKNWDGQAAGRIINVLVQSRYARASSLQSLVLQPLV